MTSRRVRCAAVAPLLGLLALISACQGFQSTAGAPSAAPTTSSRVLETLVALPNGLAGEQEAKAAAAVEAARVAAEQETARLAAEQAAAQQAAVEQESAARKTAAQVPAAPRTGGSSSASGATSWNALHNHGLPPEEWLDPVTSEHMWPGKYTAGEWVHLRDGSCWLEGTTYHASYTVTWSDGYTKQFQITSTAYPLRLFSIGWVDHNYGAAYGGRVYQEDRAIPCPMPDGY